GMGNGRCVCDRGAGGESGPEWAGVAACRVERGGDGGCGETGGESGSTGWRSEEPRHRVEWRGSALRKSAARLNARGHAQHFGSGGVSFVGRPEVGWGFWTTGFGRLRRLIRMNPDRRLKPAPQVFDEMVGTF